MKRRNDMKPRIPELLAPAGNLEKLKTALFYGADAVYLGGKALSLRAKAGNFNADEMKTAVQYVHGLQKKVYVTVNVFAHNCDVAGLEDYLRCLHDLRVDGLIVSDPGIFSVMKKMIPEVPVHLSTQANVTNYAAAQFWQDQGVVRMNLARELSFNEISEIRKEIQAELEVFVHGALCISYSGRCMLSNYLTDRDANQGNCSHPCRFNYVLSEEKRPGQYFPVQEDSRGTYIFNSKDLCLLGRLPQLVAAGVNSLKIEGRMKSIFYVGGVVRVYRAALDHLASLPLESWNAPEKIKLPRWLFDEVEKTGTRGATENFFQEKPGAEDMLYSSSRAEQVVEPVAVVRQAGYPPLVEVRNRVELGEKIEYMGQSLQDRSIRITGLTNETGDAVEVANPGNRVYLATEPQLEDTEELCILRRRRSVDS